MTAPVDSGLPRGHYQSPAVVLRTMDHGESDRIVTVFCPGLGRVNCIAKGAKRSKRRFVNKLEPFTWLDIDFRRPREGALALLAEAELRAPFMGLRRDYASYVAAAAISELMLCWTRENDGDRELFLLLLWALRQLDAGGGPAEVLILFLVKFFGLIGYQPRLDGCMECDRPGGAGISFAFSPGRGGLLCSRCRPGRSPGRRPLSPATVRLLRSAQRLPREKMARLRFSPAASRESLAMFREYGQQLLQREIQSWDFLTHERCHGDV